MKFSIPVSSTTLTQYEVEVTLSSGDDVYYSIFTDPDAGDSPGQIASSWAVEDDGSSVDSVDVIKVSFNQNLLPDDMITELIQRIYGPGVSFDAGQVLVDSVNYDFLPDAIQSLEGDVEAGFYSSIEEGIEDLIS